jgi:hypothetical protein
MTLYVPAWIPWLLAAGSTVVVVGLVFLGALFGWWLRGRAPIDADIAKRDGIIAARESEIDGWRRRHEAVVVELGTYKGRLRAAKAVAK